MVSITCARCGHTQALEGDMVTPDGVTCTPEEWLAALSLHGYSAADLVCESCLTEADRADSTGPRLDIDHG